MDRFACSIKYLVVETANTEALMKPAVYSNLTDPQWCYEPVCIKSGARWYAWDGSDVMQVREFLKRYGLDGVVVFRLRQPTADKTEVAEALMDCVHYVVRWDKWPYMDRKHMYNEHCIGEYALVSVYSEYE
jgi:hypothetical protein